MKLIFLNTQNSTFTLLQYVNILDLYSYKVLLKPIAMYNFIYNPKTKFNIIHQYKIYKH